MSFCSQCGTGLGCHHTSSQPASSTAPALGQSSQFHLIPDHLKKYHEKFIQAGWHVDSNAYESDPLYTSIGYRHAKHPALEGRVQSHTQNPSTEATAFVNYHRCQNFSRGEACGGLGTCGSHAQRRRATFHSGDDSPGELADYLGDIR